MYILHEIGTRFLCIISIDRHTLWVHNGSRIENRICKSQELEDHVKAFYDHTKILSPVSSFNFPITM